MGVIFIFLLILLVAASLSNFILRRELTTIKVNYYQNKMLVENQLKECEDGYAKLRASVRFSKRIPKFRSWPEEQAWVLEAWKVSDEKRH